MFEIEKFIPHKLPMRLIDKIIEVNDNKSICEAYLTENHIFYDKKINGIYSYVLLELMAQTSGVLARFQGGRSLDDQPRVGFLLSIRKFKSSRAYFTVNNTLRIIAEKIYIEDSLGAFNCYVSLDDEIIANARLNAIEPTDEQLKTILK